jgi:hypothetical protein
MANTLLRGSALAACLTFVAASAHAQAGGNPPDVNPTHYWSYTLIDPVIHPTPIQVSDQFFRFPVPMYVDSLARLVNWVHKDNSPVLDTLIHYTWWNVQPKLPMQVPVIVTNQFGQQPVQVEHVEFMLVPAWKNQPQPVQPNANHYLCYRAHGFNPPPQPHFFQDEWRQDVQYPYPMEFLCTPCMKEHNGQIYPPVDTLTHLAVYPITPQSDYFYPFIMDQFFAGPVYVWQKPLEYLFVPSDKKLIITDSKKASWGRIKTLYR